MARKSQCTYEPDGEPRRCCAKSKTTQSRCRQTIVPGRRVCRYHGGLGGAYPKHGRYAQGLGRFRDAYMEAMNDPSLLDLREAIALLDIVVRRAVERLEACDTPKFREAALALCERVRSEVDGEVESPALYELHDLLKRGGSEDSALDQLAKAAERMARRQEKAWGVKLDAAAAINARDLVAVMARWADIVLDEVPKDAAARVIRRIDAEVLGEGPTAIGIAAGNPA